MPIVPTPATSGASPLGAVERAPLATPFQNLHRPDMASNARLLGELGDTAGAFSSELADRTTERALLERQKSLNDFEAQLFDPQTGVFTRLEGDAIGLTKAVTTGFDKFAAGLADPTDLSNSGKIALEQFMTSAKERVLGQIRNHETSEDLKYRVNLFDSTIDDLSDRVARDALRVTSVDELGRNEEVFQAAVMQTASLTHGMGDRLGWDQDVIDQEVEKRTGRMVMARAFALAEDNPDMALQVLEDGEELIDPDEYVKIHETFELAAKDHNAYGVALEAIRMKFELDTTGEYLDKVGNTNVRYNLGPARSNPPDAAVQNLLGAGAEGILGKGATIEIFSGQEGDAPQHGSDRHMTGSAADIRIFRPDGTQVLSGDPEFAALAYEYARIGAMGIGTYEGQDTMHIDMVRPDAAQGQGNTWGPVFDATAQAELTELINGEPAGVAREGLGVPVTGVEKAQGEAGQYAEFDVGLQTILSIEDPETRSLSMAYYDKEQSFLNRQRATADVALVDDIYTRVFQDNANTPLTKLITPEEIYKLGSNIQAVQNYYKSVANGGVTTDWGVYIDQRELYRSDPAGFAAQFDAETGDPALMTSLRAQLGTSEFKEVQTMLDNATQAVAAGSSSPDPYETFSLSEIEAYANNNLLAMGLGKAPSNDEQWGIYNKFVAMVQRDAGQLAVREGRNLEPTTDLPNLVQRALTNVQSSARGMRDMTLAEAMYKADENFDTATELLGADLSIGGIPIDSDTAAGLYAAFEQAHDRAPLPSELMYDISVYLQYESGTAGRYKQDVRTPVPKQGPDVPFGFTFTEPTTPPAPVEPVSPVAIDPVLRGEDNAFTDTSAMFREFDNDPELSKGPTVVRWMELFRELNPNSTLGSIALSQLYDEWLNSNRK